MSATVNNNTNNTNNANNTNNVGSIGSGNSTGNTNNTNNTNNASGAGNTIQWTQKEEEELRNLKKWKQLKELRKLKEEDKKEKLLEFEEEYFDNDDSEDYEYKLPEMLAGYIEEIGDSGNFKKVYINDELTVTFKKVIKGSGNKKGDRDGQGVNIQLIYYYKEEDNEDYVSQSYSFSEDTIKNKKWVAILEDSIRSNETRDFTEDEIGIIAHVSRIALKRADAESLKSLNMRTLISGLYKLAYDKKMSVKLPDSTSDSDYLKWIREIDRSLRFITLLDYKHYGECICINSAETVISALLKSLEIDISPSYFKEQLKSHEYLVTAKGQVYKEYIQKKRAKDLGVRQILVIPIRDEVMEFVQEIKKDLQQDMANSIRIEDEAKKKAAATNEKRD